MGRYIEIECTHFVFVTFVIAILISFEFFNPSKNTTRVLHPAKLGLMRLCFRVLLLFYLVIHSNIKSMMIIPSALSSLVGLFLSHIRLPMSKD